MTTTKVKDLPSGGAAAVNDYFVGEHIAGTTVKLTYAPTLIMDPSPGLAGNLTLNGFGIGTVSATQIGYLSNITSDIQTQINSKYSTSNLATGMATFLNSPTSANLATTMTDETGTGALVFANTPTLVTPILNTPTSGTLTNCTGLPISTGVSGLASNVATFLATPTSANLASAITDETGTGALVFGTSPTIATPALTGRTSGSSAASGNIGQILQSTFTTGGAISTGVVTQVNSLSVPAGNWILWGVIGFMAGTGTASNGFYGAIYTSSAGIPQPTNFATTATLGATAAAQTSNPSYLMTGGLYVSLSTTTTYYLNALCNYSGGTLTMNSAIWGVRVS